MADRLCVETSRWRARSSYYERAGAAAIRFEDALVNEYGASVEELAIGTQSRWSSTDQSGRGCAPRYVARSDRALRLPAERIPRQVQDRLAAYAEAGADAIGVQLTDSKIFAGSAPLPRRRWSRFGPRARMSAANFSNWDFASR